MPPREEYWVPMVSLAPMIMTCSFYEPAQNTVSSRPTPTSASHCTDTPKSSRETSGNELAHQLANLSVAAAAATSTADENAFVENRWCQLRDTVQSTAFAVLSPERRQHQD
nr:unnamed protein product [Spirometra erinaceieuropaei]